MDDSRSPHSVHGLLHGRHLRAARVLAGLTQAELAEMAGLHTNAIRYWERQSQIGIAEGGAIGMIIAALLDRGVTVEFESEPDGHHRAIAANCRWGDNSNRTATHRGCVLTSSQ